MLKRPVFKPHLHVEVVHGEGVCLLSELRQTVLQGRLFEIVAPVLDGSPVEDVCRRLSGEAAPAQIFFTINKLEQRGFLCEHEEAEPRSQTAMWTAQGIEPATFQQRIATTTVEVRGVGVDATPLVELLKASSVKIVEGGDLLVVVADHYLNHALESINAKALESGRPWMLVKPFGGLVWLGPVLVPGSTGCWGCLATRIRSNFPIVGYLDSLAYDEDGAFADRARTPGTLSVAWGLAANAATTWIAHGGRHPWLEGKIQSLDVSTCISQSHNLVQLPHCPACGDEHQPVSRIDRPLALESRLKNYTEDGGHRVSTPHETIKKYEHHVSPICGAVTALDRMHMVNDGAMHVFTSGNNIARTPRNLFNLKVGLRNSSAGKGTNELQAKASALCEALERHSGVFRGDEPRFTAKLADLGDAAIRPEQLLLFSDRQYDEREQRNVGSSSFNYIPMRFDASREIEWTPVWSITKNVQRYVPTALCYFDYPHDEDNEFCAACSNGNAAGNNREEAILQGYFELVERDAVGMWWYNRLQRPAIDLASFNEPYIGQLEAYFRSRNRNLWAIDLTSDLGIPVIAAFSRRVDGPHEQILFGFGAHTDARIALLRAVTELNQMLAPVIDSPPEGPYHITDEDTLKWVKTATVADHPYLVANTAPARKISDFQRVWNDDLRDDVMSCSNRLAELGMEMLVLDQTRPEIGLPVVKVMAPGLRHFWQRFGPGRLYDVPVQQGWAERPLKEEELNTFPMFL